jgi:hypothetical protein
MLETEEKAVKVKFVKAAGQIADGAVDLRELCVVSDAVGYASIYQGKIENALGQPFLMQTGQSAAPKNLRGFSLYLNPAYTWKLKKYLGGTLLVPTKKLIETEEPAE